MARFTNQAQLSYGNSVINSNIASGEIMEVLAVTKTAVRNSYTQNDRITFAVSIVNTGTLPFNGVTLTDDLGSYSFDTQTLLPLTYVENTMHYYVNGILQATPKVTVGPPMEISGLTIPAGGSIFIVYETETNTFTPVDTGATVTNTVTLTGAGATPVTATSVITADDTPVLSITKSVSPVPVSENGILTYTFLIQNSGNTPVETTGEAVIRDVFDPLLTSLTVSFNGAAWTEGTNYNYDDTTGIFTTIPGQIMVPAACFTQDPVTGEWATDPGVSTLVISGTL